MEGIFRNVIFKTILIVTVFLGSDSIYFDGQCIRLFRSFVEVCRDRGGSLKLKKLMLYRQAWGKHFKIADTFKRVTHMCAKLSIYKLIDKNGIL